MWAIYLYSHLFPIYPSIIGYIAIYSHSYVSHIYAPGPATPPPPLWDGSPYTGPI